MPLITVTGDPLLTGAQMLAFGSNARGRIETTPFEHALLRQYPAAFASYNRACRQQRVVCGTYWLWRESTPRLMFCPVRESNVGATRIRFVQAVILQLARDYRRDRIESVALVPLGTPAEWRDILPVIERTLKRCALPMIIYTRIENGIKADESPALTPSQTGE